LISASIAVCRSYLSAATKLKERTGAVSMVSLAQVLGFVVGPGEMVQYFFQCPCYICWLIIRDQNNMSMWRIWV